MEEVLSFTNPAFSCFAFCVSALVIKMGFTALLTAFFRIKNVVSILLLILIFSTEIMRQLIASKIVATM